MHTITINGKRPSTMTREEKVDAIRTYAEALTPRELDSLLRIARAYKRRT